MISSYYGRAGHYGNCLSPLKSFNKESVSLFKRCLHNQSSDSGSLKQRKVTRGMCNRRNVNDDLLDVAMIYCLGTYVFLSILRDVASWGRQEKTIPSTDSIEVINKKD